MEGTSGRGTGKQKRTGSGEQQMTHAGEIYKIKQEIAEPKTQRVTLSKCCQVNILLTQCGLCPCDLSGEEDLREREEAAGWRTLSGPAGSRLREELQHVHLPRPLAVRPARPAPRRRVRTHTIIRLPQLFLNICRKLGVILDRIQFIFHHLRSLN